MAYIPTVTLNVELSDGGRDEKISSQYEAQQQWYSEVNVAPPDEKVVDNVQEGTYKTEVTFWEPYATLRPLLDLLAFVTRQFFFVVRALEAILIIRANPI